MERKVLTKEEIKIQMVKQREIMMQMKKINDDYYLRTGRRKKHLCVTFGCQMNENDSEKMLGMLNIMGYEETDDQAEADLILYNTCLIRENAELKVYGNLGALKELKRKNPEMIIGVCGCMMQKEHIRAEISKKYRHVDLVFGTHNYHMLPEYLMRIEEKHVRVSEIWEDSADIVEDMPVSRKYDFKAFINIMYGCNNFCTYCVVPYSRGREKSREVQDILDEITALAKEGYKEITLLGQNVNSYGKTLEHPITFAELLEKVNAIEGVERIRFMTSHPKDISFDLLETMAKCDKVCKQLHLPVQSGSNTVLTRMNRHYTRERYLEVMKRAKELMPELTVSTDIIVGFPGETEADFEETLSLVEAVGYDAAYMFLYSVREGTPAAKMADQVPEEVKHARFDRLLEVMNRINLGRNEACIGEVMSVLVEGTSKNKEEYLTGRTDGFKLVHFKGDDSLVGQIVNIKITGVRTFSMTGELVE